MCKDNPHVLDTECAEKTDILSVFHSIVAAGGKVSVYLNDYAFVIY